MGWDSNPRSCNFRGSTALEVYFHVAVQGEQHVLAMAPITFLAKLAALLAPLGPVTQPPPSREGLPVGATYQPSQLSNTWGRALLAYAYTKFARRGAAGTTLRGLQQDYETNGFSLGTMQSLALLVAVQQGYNWASTVSLPASVVLPNFGTAPQVTALSRLGQVVDFDPAVGPPVLTPTPASGGAPASSGRAPAPTPTGSSPWSEFISAGIAAAGEAATAAGRDGAPAAGTGATSTSPTGAASTSPSLGAALGSGEDWIASLLPVRAPTPAPAPAAGMSTGAKWGLGLGLGAAVVGVGVAATRSKKAPRRRRRG